MACGSAPAARLSPVINLRGEANEDRGSRTCSTASRPLIEPYLDFSHGRTRARLREDVHFRKIVLVSTSDWWEKDNMNTVVHIVQELAENASVEFSGALLRPHAFIMKADGALTPAGEAVPAAARSVGDELIREGWMTPHTPDAISPPLISEEALRERYNRWI